MTETQGDYKTEGGAEKQPAPQLTVQLTKEQGAVLSVVGQMLYLHAAASSGSPEAAQQLLDMIKALQEGAA